MVKIFPMIRKILFRFSDLIFILVLIALTIPVYKFLLTVPLYSVIGDAQRYNGYQAYIIKHSIENYGQFALWDQFLSSGMSWISHPGGALFFPTTWLIITFFKDMMFGSRIFFFIHAITASISMYFLLRVLGLQKITSFLISATSSSTQYALIFGINGWFEEFFGLTLMPLTTGLLWLTFTKKSYICAILGGLVMSLHFFGNSYYVFHYNVIAILWIELAFLIRELWSVFRKKKRDWRDVLKYAISNIIFWAVFVGISAIKLLPLLEFRGISARSVLPLSIIETPNGVMSFQFFYKIFRDFIIPAGHTDSFTHWANDLAIFFIILSIFYFLFKRSFKYGIFLGLFIIGVWGYFANLIPVDLYAFIYTFLPGFNSNQYPYRFMIIIHFAFLGLAALGLDILIRRKFRIFNLLGIALGLVILIATISYSRVTTASLKFQKAVDIKNELEKFPNFKVVKTKELNTPPSLIGKIPENLLAILSSISSKYGYEGRTYSTFNSLEKGFSSINIFNGKIRSVHHSYQQIVPTYQFGITPQGSFQDNLERTKKRYKIFSVLNTRFQLQQKEYSEYSGCNKLSSSKVEALDEIKPSDGVCEFLGGRLISIITKEEGGIYYDKEVLPKFSLIPYPILLISDNRFNDYSGFIAKQIMFHPDFDINTMTVLSGGSSYLDEYNLEILKQFSGVLLVEPKIKDKKNADSTLKQYEKNGGKILYLTSKWNHYESLHERSGSVFTNKPAWTYSDKDSQLLSNLFNSLKTNKKQDSIDVKKFTPEDVLLSVETIKDNQVLQFSDSFYPGWKAEVDKKPANVYMADGLVKGVVIKDAGDHEVRFFYSPDSFKKGAIISSLTAFAILGGVSFYILKRKRYIH